jgi:FixJ family two-component response regulator
MPEGDDQLVCIVDDDRRSAAHSATCSRPPGFGVETFESGGAFLEAGDRGRIGCLVLEVRMAGMSGVDVLRQLATAGVAIPTIVRTVHGDDETPSQKTGREGPRAPQSTAAPPAMPGLGTEKRG